MRLSLIILVALGLSTAANAQTAMLTTDTKASTTLPDPGVRPEARDLIAQLMETELQTPDLKRNRAKLVYVDVKGEAATVRVDHTRMLPVKSFYYHLRQKDGQWVIVSRDNSSLVVL